MMGTNPKKDMEFVQSGQLSFANRKDKIFWIRHLIGKYPEIKMNSIDLNAKKKEQEEKMKQVAYQLAPHQRVVSN